MEQCSVCALWMMDKAELEDYEGTGIMACPSCADHLEDKAMDLARVVVKATTIEELAKGLRREGLEATAIPRNPPKDEEGRVCPGGGVRVGGWFMWRMEATDMAEGGEEAWWEMEDYEDFKLLMNPPEGDFHTTPEQSPEIALDLLKVLLERRKGEGA